MCGVLGITGHPHTKLVFPTLLMSLQHRGHDAAGMAGFSHEERKRFSCIETFKSLGKASAIITADVMKKFSDLVFIGHTRYSTRNKSRSNREIHPHLAQSIHGKLAIVTNGDLINVEELLVHINDLKVKIYSENDAEMMAALINIQIRKNGKKVFQAIRETMELIKGGYAALLLMEDDSRLFAFRDPYGIRPLHMGKFVIEGKKCVIFASETCSFDIIERYNQAKYPYDKISFTHREVKPGEIIAVNSNSEVESSFDLSMEVESSLFRKPHLDRIGCVFETIYFSRPDSKQRGESFQALRERMGMELFQEAPMDADMVTAVPKGGIPSAVGYSKASGIPYYISILEEPTTGGARSFITNDEERQELAVMKYNILDDMVKGKRMVVVDDSIVRGTTAKLLVEKLFQSGAAEVHLRIPCPPYKFPCHYGIETRDPKTLIFHKKSVDEIRDQLGATSLAYLSVSGLYKAIAQDRSLFCDECLSNRSPFQNF